MRTVRHIAAYALLVSMYGFTWVVATLARVIPRRSWKPTGRIMVTGTFFNPNWYLSHVTPLARSGVSEVILVTDAPKLPLERVRFSRWPGWLAGLLSRTGARAVWMLILAYRYRPDLYMGYHLGPGACTVLVIGRLMGRPTCYQMTGGPVEIIGGGVHSVEGVGACLRRPSRMIETMALAVARQYELIVVRGGKAKQFLATHNVKGSIAVITGSVDTSLQRLPCDRQIHLVFVGRLAPIKQVDQFIDIVGLVRRRMPSVRAAIVGDGPLMDRMKARVDLSGLTANVEFLGKTADVKSVLSCSKVFVLTSRSEGLSIAMAEAMALGVVPVVADVGELSDLVVNGVNGHLVKPNNIRVYAASVLSLLRDPALWSQYSDEAVEAARRVCGIDVVSRKWQKHLRDTVSQASGCCLREGGITESCGWRE